MRLLRLQSLCLVVAVLSSTLLVGQTVEEYPLRPPVPKAAEAPPEETTYRLSGLDDRGFNRVVRRVSAPTLLVYHPDAAKSLGVGLVAIPGGGYNGIVIDREGHALARFFQAKGITVAVLKYRLPQVETFAAGLPAPQQDALEAIRFVRQHAAAWKLRPDRVGVVGASAGGHLAGSTAIFGRLDDGSRPDFVALLYPVVTLAGPWAHAGSRQNLLGETASPARVSEFSLEQRARRDLPPFFLAHARDDKTVPVENSTMLATALQQAGVPVESFIVATGGHGFALGRGEESARWKDRFLHWLEAWPKSAP